MAAPTPTDSATMGTVPDFPRERLARTPGAVLPSGQTYSAENADELAAFALEARDDDELAGHLRTALAFVVRCFKREPMGEN